MVTQLKQYGMELRKWASSHSDIIVELPQHLRDSAEEDKFLDQNYKIKTLRISWKPNLDSFIFHSKFSDISRITKGNLLSETAKLFDPVGWLGPVVIQFRILLQKIWTQGVGWDGILPAETEQQWIEMKSGLLALQYFTLPRCIVPSQIVGVQFHLFTDASESAYSAVVYSCKVDENGFISTNVIAVKTRVPPIKTILFRDWNYVVHISEQNKSFSSNEDI